MTMELTDETAEVIARRFRALSDPTRLRLLNHLRREEEASVGEIAEAIASSQQNVSKHLATLHDEGFVARRKDGTSTLYWISDPTVLEICERVCAGIEAQLEELRSLASAGGS